MVASPATAFRTHYGLPLQYHGAPRLALHPERRLFSPPARRALDLLLGRETRERYALGFEVARLLGAEPSRGFITYFARFDLGLLLSLCSQLGAGTDDPRLGELVAFIQSQQGEFGLWEYPSQPHMARWVTFDLLRSLSHLDASAPWLSAEPLTPSSPIRRSDSKPSPCRARGKPVSPPSA
jgi:hypothetical protein